MIICVIKGRQKVFKNPKIDIIDGMLIKCNDISIEDLLSIQKELKNQENEIDAMIEELIKV